MSVAEAVKELHAELQIEEYSADLVAEIAEGYELNPKLVERKFEESYGVAAAEYVKPQPVEINPEKAIEKAKQLHKTRFIGGEATTGVVFEHQGRKAVSIAWTHKGHHWLYADTMEQMITSWKTASGRDRAYAKFLNEQV